MIELTRLNGNHLVINSDLIQYAEAAPDTVLTLVNGEKIVVLESCAEVMDRVVVYRAHLLGETAKLFPEAAALMNVSVALSAIAAGQQARSADAIESDHGAALRRRADR